MSARVRERARAITALEGGDLDDLGALITAMRHMLTGGAPLGDHDAGALYTLAAMAEAAWHRIDAALQPPPSLREGEIDIDG